VKGAKPKEWRTLLGEVAATPGWKVEMTNASHVKVIPPEGRALHFGYTLSEYRGLANNRAKLKRAGWPPPLELPVCPLPPKAPEPTTERETPMNTTDEIEWSIYHPRPGETQLEAASRFLRANANSAMTRQQITDAVGVPNRNLGEMAKVARENYGSNRPGIYLVTKGRPARYAWLDQDYDRAVLTGERKRTSENGERPDLGPLPPPQMERAVVLREVFSNEDITVYRRETGELVRLVPVDFVFVDRS